MPQASLQYNIVAVENSTGHCRTSVVVSGLLRDVAFSWDIVVSGKFVDEEVATSVVCFVAPSFVCGSIWAVPVTNNVEG